MDPVGKGNWYLHDFDTIIASSEDSWRCRLQSVADAVMEQWVWIKNRFKQESKAIVDPSCAVLEQILERIPTPPTSTNEYPPFPMPDLTLKEWIDGQSLINKITEDELVAAEVIQEHTLLVECKGTLSDQSFSTTTINPNEYIQQLTAESKQGAAHHPAFACPLTPPPVKLIIDSSVSPVKMYTPELDPAEFAFISGNTATKVNLAIAYA